MSKYADVLKNTQVAAAGPPAVAAAAGAIVKPTLSNRSLQQCAKLLQTLGANVATLSIKELQRFWLQIMADPTASHKDKLQASKLYAESIGAFREEKKRGINGANIRWKAEPIDAEIVEDKVI